VAVYVFGQKSEVER
jgi:hypothetical protein